MKYIAIFLLLANLGYFAWLNLAVAPVTVPIRPEPAPLLSDGMILLSEYQAQVAEDGLIARQQSQICLIITGFANRDDANGFVDEVAASGLQTTLQPLGEVLPSQFRVYLAPASSRAIATITLDGLSERASETATELEFYLITRGTLENGIALGVFDSREEALEIQAQVSEMGYSPEIQEIPRSDGGISVTLRTSGSLTLDSMEWLDLVAERPYLKATENLCETIAQGEQFP